MDEYFIGLMSGTSLDGIDCCLVKFTPDTIHTLGFHYTPYNEDLKQRLLRISAPGQHIYLNDYGKLDAELGRLYAGSVQALLEQTGMERSLIKAIGSHGQTVFHGPTPPYPFTLQIGDPNIIAETTGITTVADLRRRDMAANGQGAPLVPAFHQAVFASTLEHRCIVNIGGIANITVLPKDSSRPVIGFDTGPGNILSDFWIKQHKGLDYDAGGEWAKSGQIDTGLAAQLKQDGYFHAEPPKSTGREYFSEIWLNQSADLTKFAPETVQATLVYLTAGTIADAIKRYAPETQRVLIGGGGAHNAFLLDLLKLELALPVETTETYGVHPDHLEAAAFAWLARQTLNRKPGNLTTVTGASRPVILGGIYPGTNGLD